MIFLFVGCILVVVGLLFRVLPAPYDIKLYGYGSPLARQDERLWKYAQKVSSSMLLFIGMVMAIIGCILKYFGWTNFFIIEMLLLVFPIMPIFIVTEKKLTEYAYELQAIDEQQMKSFSGNEGEK